jgi:2-dehydropantoate 2-reductase
MRIVVFGAGAVGSFFGALLVRGGQDVTFIARGAQLEALRRSGIRIESTLLGTIEVPHVAVVERAASIDGADLVLVCVKAHQTTAILDDIAELAGTRGAVVTLQNGVESDEPVAARIGRHRVFPGVVYVGATADRPGMVSHVAAGTIAVGSRPGGDESRLPAIREALAASGQPVRISTDIQRDRWRKLIWNAGFNTVSALTGEDPGALLAFEPTRRLLTAIMREVVAVAKARGIALDDADVDEQIVWTERAGAIRTSTTVDRERGREMEIDALVGVVVREGRAAAVPTPCSEAVHALLGAVARHEDANGSHDGATGGGGLYRPARRA